MLSLIINRVIVLLILSSFYSLSLAEAPLYQTPQFSVKKTADVIYAHQPINNPVNGTANLMLELYEPIGSHLPKNRPVLIGIHGGSFKFGSRKSPRINSMCKEAAKYGYTCLSIDYRLQGQNAVVGEKFTDMANYLAAQLTSSYPTSTVAAATEDTVAVMQWLVDNKQQLGIDPNKLAIFGHSAGGFLSLILAYMYDEGNFNRPIIPQAVLSLSGSPARIPNFISPNDPALIISHGTSDIIVPVANANIIERYAINAGIINHKFIIEGGTHGNINELTTEVAPGLSLFEYFLKLNYEQFSTMDSIFKETDNDIPFLAFPMLSLLAVLFVFTGLKDKKSS